MENGVDTLSLAIDASRVRRGAREFEGAGRTIERSGRRVDRSVDRTDRKMKKLGTTAGSVSGTMARFLGGAAAIAGARSAIRTFATYEQSIATIRGVLGGQIKDQEVLNASMEKISKTARELGATTRFSASEAADGLLELTRAGFSTAESTSAIAATLNLAQTGAIELGQASEITAGLVRGFGIDASEAGRVVDVLVAQSNRAKVEVADLGMAVSKFGPLAHAMGVSIEEAAAAAGVLADAGTPAETAGINMRQVLIKLIKPTGEAKKAIEDMGLSLDDVNPQMHSLVDIFEKFAARGLDAEKAAAIFMSRNTNAALLLAGNTEKMKGFTAANINAAGEAAAFAKIMDDTLVGSFKSLISAIQELVLQFGEGEGGFGAVLREVVDTTTSAVRILAGMEATVTENRKAAFLLAAALKGVGIAATILVGLKLTTIASSLLVSLTAIPSVLASISASLIPIAATMAAIGTAALSFELGRYFFDEFKSVQVTMAGFVKFLDQSWAQVKAGWKLLMADLLDLLSTDFVSGAVDLISGFAVEVASIFDILFPGFSENLEGMLTGTTAVMKTASNFTGQMRKDILSELDEDMKFAELVMANSIDAIENEFNGRERKGNNFAEFVKGDLAKAETEVLAFIDGLAAKAEAAFTDATSSEDDPSLMGPFPEGDGMGNLAEIVAQMEAAMGMLGDETKTVADATADAAEKYETWIEELEEARTALQIEIALLEGVSDAERVLIEAKQRGIALSQEQLDMLTRMEEEIIVLDRQKEKAEELKDLYDDIGNEIAGNFQDVVFGAKSAEDAIEDMVRNITKLVFEMMVTQQIANLISGGLSSAFGGGGGGGGGTTTQANGGVWSEGLTPAASGMVVTPTRMRSGGRNILGGEAGPEAIVPLARDSRGRLGIRDSGGGGGGGGTVNVAMTVVTRDKRSFESRESQKQIERRLRRTINRAEQTPG